MHTNSPREAGSYKALKGPFWTFSIALILLTVPLTTLAANEEQTIHRDGEDVIVPADADILLEDGELATSGRLIVRGTIQSPTGTDLVLEAEDGIEIVGTVLAGHGEPAQDGGDVVLRTNGPLELGSDGSIQAGAGGHAAPVSTPGDRAVATDGGEGGSVIVDATAPVLEGEILAGSGGRGGDAYGATAIAGDGGDAGASIIADQRVPTDSLTANPQPPVLLDPPAMTKGCGEPDTGTPGSSGTGGGDGGDAYACGSDGSDGSVGSDGEDDHHGSLSGESSCVPYQNSDPHPPNGMIGEDGGNGLVGLSATAIGGAGGNAASGDHDAGDGGDATARGGDGGDGGHGGMGGHGGTVGDACDGGNGGDGARGGDAAATAGAQGLNAIDCARDGTAGSVQADGGDGGSGARGGGGGGANAPYVDGSRGNHGSGASDGSSTTTPESERPCYVPGQPTISVVGLHPHELDLWIQAPAGADQAAVTEYVIYQNRSSGDTTESTSWTIPYDGAITMETVTGLSPETWYYFEARPDSNLGLGPFSNEASGQTIPEVVPDAPSLSANGVPGSNAVDLVINQITQEAASPVQESSTGGDSPTIGPKSHRAVEYDVYHQVLSIGDTCPLATQLSYAFTTPRGGIGGTTHRHNGLPFNSKHCYAVKAVTPSGTESAFSNVASGTVPPLTPVSVGPSDGLGDLGGTSVNLDAPSTTAIGVDPHTVQVDITEPTASAAGTVTVTTYKVFRSGPLTAVSTCPPSSSLSHVANVSYGGAVTSHADSGLQPSSKYCYMVKAVAQTGDVSPGSNIASTMTAQLLVGPDPTNAPSVSARQDADGHTVLDITPPTGTTPGSYLIYRDDYGGSEDCSVFQQERAASKTPYAGQVTSWTDGPRFEPADSVDCYQVVAVYEDGTRSKRSNTVSETPTDTPRTPDPCRQGVPCDGVPPNAQGEGCATTGYTVSDAECWDTTFDQAGVFAHTAVLPASQRDGATVDALVAAGTIQEGKTTSLALNSFNVDDGSVDMTGRTIRSGGAADLDLAQGLAIVPTDVATTAYSLSDDGKTAWSSEVTIEEGTVTEDGQTYVGVSGGSVAALDVESGRLLWRTNLELGDRAQVATKGGLAFVTDGTVVYTMSANNGESVNKAEVQMSTVWDLKAGDPGVALLGYVETRTQGLDTRIQMLGGEGGTQWIHTIDLAGGTDRPVDIAFDGVNTHVLTSSVTSGEEVRTRAVATVLDAEGTQVDRYGSADFLPDQAALGEAITIQGDTAVLLADATGDQALGVFDLATSELAWDASVDSDTTFDALSLSGDMVLSAGYKECQDCEASGPTASGFLQPAADLSPVELP